MSKIFRSRWSALFWAAGIVWTAYDVAEANAPPKHAATTKAEARPVDATGAAVSDQDLALVADLINGS